MYRFDHDELFALAGWLTSIVADLDDTRWEIERVLVGVGRRSEAVARLDGVSDACERRARDLSDRALFLADAGRGHWDQASRARRDLARLWWDIGTFSGSDNDERLDVMVRLSGSGEASMLAALAGLSAAQVAALTTGLPDEVGRRLAWLNPDVVASTDGMPLGWRELATRRLMAAEAERLRLIVADELRTGDRADGELEAMVARLDLLDGWLASDRTFVWYDPVGDGQLVEVVGDLDGAAAVGVFVPGIGSELATFELVASHARSLVGAAEHIDERVAVVAWLGYDAPAGVGFNLELALSDKASAGAPSLVGFVDGLAAQRPDIPLSIVAHSYGSVVAGWAATFDHLNADRLIIVGSPNVAGSSIDDLNLPPGTPVFVGEAPYDVAVGIGDISDGWRDEWSGLGHGYDPGDCDWGAVVFEVQDAGIIDAHTTYTSGQSAEAIIKIMVGKAEDVIDLCGETAAEVF